MSSTRSNVRALGFACIWGHQIVLFPPQYSTYSTEQVEQSVPLMEACLPFTGFSSAQLVAWGSAE